MGFLSILTCVMKGMEKVIGKRKVTIKKTTAGWEEIIKRKYREVKKIQDG